MRKVPAPKVATAIEATESPLPPEIREALGELVGAAREGLLALSMGLGLGVSLTTITGAGSQRPGGHPVHTSDQFTPKSTGDPQK